MTAAVINIQWGQLPRPLSCPWYESSRIRVIASSFFSSLHYLSLGAASMGAFLLYKNNKRIDWLCLTTGLMTLALGVAATFIENLKPSVRDPTYILKKRREIEENLKTKGKFVSTDVEFLSTFLMEDEINNIVRKDASEKSYREFIHRYGDQIISLLDSDNLQSLRPKYRDFLVSRNDIGNDSLRSRFNITLEELQTANANFQIRSSMKNKDSFLDFANKKIPFERITDQEGKKYLAEKYEEYMLEGYWIGLRMYPPSVSVFGKEFIENLYKKIILRLVEHLRSGETTCAELSRCINLEDLLKNLKDTDKKEIKELYLSLPYNLITELQEFKDVLKIELDETFLRNKFQEYILTNLRKGELFVLNCYEKVALSYGSEFARELRREAAFQVLHALKEMNIHISEFEKQIPLERLFLALDENGRAEMKSLYLSLPYNLINSTELQWVRRILAITNHDIEQTLKNRWNHISFLDKAFPDIDGFFASLHQPFSPGTKKILEDTCHFTVRKIATIWPEFFTSGLLHPKSVMPNGQTLCHRLDKEISHFKTFFEMALLFPIVLFEYEIINTSSEFYIRLVIDHLISNPEVFLETPKDLCSILFLCRLPPNFQFYKTKTQTFQTKLKQRFRLMRMKLQRLKKQEEQAIEESKTLNEEVKACMKKRDKRASPDETFLKTEKRKLQKERACIELNELNSTLKEHEQGRISLEDLDAQLRKLDSSENDSYLFMKEIIQGVALWNLKSFEKISPYLERFPRLIIPCLYYIAFWDIMPPPIKEPCHYFLKSFIQQLKEGISDSQYKMLKTALTGWVTKKASEGKLSKELAWRINQVPGTLFESKFLFINYGAKQETINEFVLQALARSTQNAYLSRMFTDKFSEMTTKVVKMEEDDAVFEGLMEYYNTGRICEFLREHPLKKGDLCKFAESRFLDDLIKLCKE